MATLKKKKIRRTVHFWQLVDNSTGAPVAERNWYGVMKAISTEVITHRVLEKEITGKVFTGNPPKGTEQLIMHSLHDDFKDSYDGAAYVLVLSTEKDYVPNQRHRTSGDQKPMGTDDQHVPVDNTFVYFLPLGNFMAVLQESAASIRPNYICGWLDRVMQNKGLLPQHNFHWDSRPLLDSRTRAALQDAGRLRSATIGATLTPAQNSGFKTLFGGGDQYGGAFELEIKVRHVKKYNPAHHVEDTEQTYEWFTETFGKLEGKGLKKAKVVLDGPGRRTGEIDLMQHRLTRKAEIVIEKRDQSINSSSALDAMVGAFAAQADQLKELRP